MLFMTAVLHCKKFFLHFAKIYEFFLAFVREWEYTAPESSTGPKGETTMAERFEPLGKNLFCYVQVIVLAVAMALNYQLFVFPNAFAPAGINGIGTMVQYLFHFSIGYLSLIINIPLIIFAWRHLDRDFANKSLLFVLVFSGATLVMNRMDLSVLAYNDGYSAILGPAVAGIISGAIYGVVIRLNGSTGGTDIVAAWVRKRHPEMSMVWVIFGLNASVAGLSFFVYGLRFEPVILCLMYCYLSSSVGDRFLKGGKSALKFEVITTNPKELSGRLIRELGHSATVLPAQGMYSDTPRYLLICVVNKHQIARFQSILQEYPDSFAYVSGVNETMGNFHKIA